MSRTSYCYHHSTQFIYPMKLSLIAFNCRYTHSCLSLFYVRQELKNNVASAEITLNQFTINDPYYSTLIHISNEKTDAFFFSVYIWNAEYLKRLITDLAAIRPKTPIIIGGPQAAALFTKAGHHPICLVQGEIEAVPQHFYADLTADSLKPEYIAGSAELFPSPYLDSDFTKHLANRHIYYESSRGCPYSCSYCLSASESGIRNKSLATVKKELAEILAHHPQTVRFVDRTFNASIERTLEIWNFLLTHAKETTFHFEISPDLFSEEMFSFLEKIPIGLFQFEIGIQSTNPQTLSAINRKTNIQKVQKNIRRLVELDTMHLHVDLILGLPYEDTNSFKKSFDTVFSLRPHYIQMGLLKILPNTPISRQTQEFSIHHCEQPPYEALSTKWLSHQELTSLYWIGECMEAFYNNRYFASFFAFIQKTGVSGFDFFSDMHETCVQFDLFNRAKTQRLMSRILYEISKKHSCSKLLTELLRFDWLRSGHRFLPDHLSPDLLREDKKQLWSQMPQEYPPLYTVKTRNTFFKQSLFLIFSSEALEELGLVKDMQQNLATVCFLNEKEKSVFQLTKVEIML